MKCPDCDKILQVALSEGMNVNRLATAVKKAKVELDKVQTILDELDKRPKQQLNNG